MADPGFLSRHKHPLVIGALSVAFVVLAVAYNWALPLFEGPDEGAHYLYIDYVANHHTLPDPLHSVSHETAQTPLYYIFGAPLIAWIDRSDYGAVYRPDPTFGNGIVYDHTSQELVFPPSGTTLAIRILRLYSTVLGLLTVLFIYAGVRVLFDREDVALVALAVTAFNPKFLHISSQVDNDIALACASAFCMWVLMKVVKRSDPRSSWSWVVLGLSFGIAVTTKVSGLVLAAPIALVLVWCAVKARRLSIWWMAQRSLLCMLGFLLAYGGLMADYAVRYGSVLPLFQQANATGIRPVPLSAMDILARMPRVIASYWGEFGHGVEFPPYVDLVMGVVVIVVAVGTIRALIRRQFPAEMTIPAFGLVVVFVAFIAWMRNQDGSENLRLISPGFMAVSAFTAAGLMAWFPVRARQTGALAITFLSVIGAVIGLRLSLVSGYALPAYLSDEQVAVISHLASVHYQNGIELVGATLSTRRISPGDTLHVSVYWRATRPITDVYRVVVEARNDSDMALGRITTLPLGGRFNTMQMEVGRVFRDDYEMPVSATVRSLVHVYVGWYLNKPPYTVSHLVENNAANAQIGLVKLRGPEPAEIKPGMPFTSTLGTLGILEGYKVQGDELTLYWRARSWATRDYTVFVHALDAKGQTIGQADAPPAYPTSLWDKGEQVITTYHVPDLNNASAFSVGLYNPVTSQRVKAYRPDGSSWPDDAIVIPVRLEDGDSPKG